MKRTKFPEPTNQEEEFQIGIPNITIPSEVLFHPDLNNTEKLLFGALTILAQGKKGCTLSNQTLGQFLNTGKQTISNALANLKKYKYITIESENKNGRFYRRIFINPEYKTLYHQLITMVHDQLISGSPYKKNYRDPYKKIYRYIYYVNNKNNKSASPEKQGEAYSNNLTSKSKKQNSPINEKQTWNDLISKYGKEQVKFVKYFLRRQKKQFPKLIKDEITPNNSRVLSSLDCLDKLQRIDKFDFETEIKPTIELALDDPFWARNLLSLGSLRNKGSNGEKKFINIQTTLSHRSAPLASQISESPQDIINKQSWDKDVKDLMIKKVFTPIFRKKLSESEKIEITKTICQLNTWLIERQRRPAPPKTDEEYLKKKSIYEKWLYLPKSHKVILDFVTWLLNQTWITDLKPGHFEPEGKTFRTFLEKYQREIGFDILEGRRL